MTNEDLRLSIEALKGANISLEQSIIRNNSLIRRYQKQLDESLALEASEGMYKIIESEHKN